MWSLFLVATSRQTVSAASASTARREGPAASVRILRTRRRWARRRAPPVRRPPESPFRSDAQTDCLCSLGFYGAQGWPCTECAANAYADALGTAACTACPADSEVTPRSDAQTDCLCRPGPAPRVCQTLTPLSSTRRSVLRVPQTQRPSAQAPPSQTASVCPDSRGRTAARAQRSHRAPSSPRRAPRPAPTAYMQH